MAEKLQHLRAVEGQLRGLGRPLTKTEVIRLMRTEIGDGISLPYLSQIEGGSRPHLTGRSRELLARFFRVHPSYLVDDPEGFAESLSLAVEPPAANLGDWLRVRGEELRTDPELYEAWLRLSARADAREVLIALGDRLTTDHPQPRPTEEHNGH